MLTGDVSPVTVIPAGGVTDNVTEPGATFPNPARVKVAGELPPGATVSA